MPKLSHYAQGTPNWVDLQTTDQSAAKQFYASLLGWSSTTTRCRKAACIPWPW